MTLLASQDLYITGKDRKKRKKSQYHFWTDR